MPLLFYYENEKPNFVATLSDGATNKYPRCYVYNYDKTLKETLDLTHNANGQYIVTAPNPYLQGNYSVVYKVFSDSGHTTLDTDYDVEEDNLIVSYRQIGGVSSGGVSNVLIDVKKIADAVWEHAFPKKLLELIEKIKAVVAKITDTKVLAAIKAIKIPEVDFSKIKFPKFPEQKEVDLSPILEEVRSIAADLKDQIDAIPEYDDTSLKKEVTKAISLTDYGETLNEVVSMLEKLMERSYSLEMYNEINQVVKDIKDLNGLDKKIDKLQTLLTKYKK